jgi:hypothetical protein
MPDTRLEMVSNHLKNALKVLSSIAGDDPMENPIDTPGNKAYRDIASAQFILSFLLSDEPDEKEIKETLEEIENEITVINN